MPAREGLPGFWYVAVVCSVAGVLSTSCSRAERTAERTAGPLSTRDWFVDAATVAGLDFVHVNGMSGALYLAEIMGPGAALFDFDNDGDVDVYLVQGGLLGRPNAGVAVGDARERHLRDRLYRNDVQVHPDGRRTARFVDVTARSGIENSTAYGMGVAAGDINNDGWIDLYVTRLGADAMLRNNGDGTFTDISRPVGIRDDSWSVSASFLDYDRDGWLDLYVGNYVRYDVATDIDCRGPTGAVDYCTPQVYTPTPGHLYRNRGNGTFVDATLGAGLTTEYGPTLGSSAADFNGDGWIDLYVANDGTPNQLWLNQRNGKFRNGAVLAGVAVSAEGRPEGSMGVDAADFDNDGDEDVVVTNLFGQGTVLYANDGAAAFDDRGAASGLRTASLRHTGFGVGWIDVDNDGWLDVLSANGAVQLTQPFGFPSGSFPLGQPMQLFRNRADGRFDDLSASAGRAFTALTVGRGAAFGDVDNDGDVDVLVANNNGPVRLLINQIGNQNHWLGLRLLTADGGRDALGARVGLTTPDGSTRWRRVRSDGSYGSANDPRVIIGLGKATTHPRIRIQWPGGTTEERVVEGIDRWLTIREQKGP